VSGFSPARLLAPLALVLTALALIVVVSSGGDDPSSSTAQPEATATATPASERSERRREREQEAEPETTTYEVQSGDSPSSIAAEEGISVDALLEANPDIDPNALAVGDELEIPEG
jgi:LysM repeat protein